MQHHATPYRPVPNRPTLCTDPRTPAWTIILMTFRLACSPCHYFPSCTASLPVILMFMRFSFVAWFLCSHYFFFSLDFFFFFTFEADESGHKRSRPLCLLMPITVFLAVSLKAPGEKNELDSFDGRAGRVIMVCIPPYSILWCRKGPRLSALTYC